VKANKDTRKRLNGSTELKRWEEERERLINQFLAEPCHLLTVMRWMPIGMIVADSSSSLILSNQRVQQIWRHDFVPANSIEEYQAYHGFHPDRYALQARGMAACPFHYDRRGGDGRGDKL
jgi:hypothetical protein